MPTQDHIFLSGEGAAYAKRNAHHRYDHTKDPVWEMCCLMDLKPRRILDYGCGDGSRLLALCNKFESLGQGVDPGAVDGAISDRAGIYKGTMASYGAWLGNGEDLIIASFVFHWIDRSELLKSLMMMDLHCAPGGNIIIQDFHSPTPTKRRYHHRTDVELWTYKADYPAMLTATGLYREVCRTLHPYEGGPEQYYCACLVKV